MKRLFILLLCCLSLPAWAVNQNFGELEQLVRGFVQAELSQRPNATFKLGRFPHNLVLPACEAPRVAWTSGMAQSGNSFIDISCADPLWRIRVSVQIAEPRMGLVFARAMQAGDMITADDIQQSPIADQSMGRDVLGDPAQVIGQTVGSSVSAGIWVRSFMVKPPVVVKMNQRVKVIISGDGFSVEAEGVATANAHAGEIVAVRMPNGGLIRGAVNADGSVSLAN
jgi:flagella basal body P-ring formation protein FlgA